MELQIIKKIDIDFYDNKIITVNAKQFDTSRYVLIDCYIHNVPFYLNSENQSVFVRYKKDDEYSVFNTCNITKDGSILVELTEQMLIEEGLCIADLVVVDKTNISPPQITEDGDIILQSNVTIISTMKFYINVISAPFEYDELESSSEYQGLVDLFNKAYQDYSEVITLSKANQEAAQEAADSASQSAENAKTSEDNAKVSEDNAKASEIAAKTSEDNAKDSELNAQTYANNASSSAQDAEDYSNLSKSYAIGDTGTRDGENTDNSKYYSQQAQTSATSASSSATAAKTSEDNAKDSETNAQTYANNASSSASTAQGYAEDAQEYADAAAQSAADAAAEANLSSIVQLSIEEPSSQPINGLWLKEIS